MKNKASNSRGAFYVAGAIFVLFVFDVAICYDDTFAVLSLLISTVSLGYAFWFFGSGIQCIAAARLRYGLFACTLALVLLMLFGVPILWKGGAYWAAKYIRFAINEERYVAQIAHEKPDSRGLRFYAIPWGGFMLNGVELVFDESDEIGLPAHMQSEYWRTMSERRHFADCSAVHLRRHFYVVSC